MDVTKFPNPKFEAEVQKKLTKTWDLETQINPMNEYLPSIKHYIYTEIEHDYPKNDPKHLFSWVLHIVGSNLMRSLYYRNAFVENINSQNFLAAMLPLKAWFEIAACLASIRDLLSSNNSLLEKQDSLMRYVMGNKGNGSFRVGNIESVNVQTMIQKGDKFFQDHIISDDQKINFFTDYYDNISNFSHPNHDSQSLVSDIVGSKTIMQGTEQISEFFILEKGDYGGLLLTPMLIECICADIFDGHKAQFNEISARLFFI
jgi:hypothetical protein